jgi:hypothetical protein
VSYADLQQEGRQDVQNSKIFATNYTYGYSKPCKAVLGMAGTKCKKRKLDKEDERGAAENMFDVHLTESA